MEFQPVKFFDRGDNAASSFVRFYLSIKVKFGIYNILDIAGVLQVFQLKGTRNVINRNDSTFYKIYTFYLEKIHNSCKCAHNLILSYSAHKEPLF